MMCSSLVKHLHFHIVVQAFGDAARFTGYKVCGSQEMAHLGDWALRVYAGSMTSLAKQAASADYGWNDAVLHVVVYVEAWSRTNAMKRHLDVSSMDTDGFTNQIHGARWDSASQQFSPFAWCRSDELHHLTMLGCNIFGLRNGVVLESRGHGRVQYATPGEMVECSLKNALPADGSSPYYFNASVAVRLSSAEATNLTFQLCKVRDDPIEESGPRIVACSMPMFDYHQTQMEHRFFLEDWLEYHHEYFDIDFQVYDVDGSFEGPLRPFRFVEYVKFWPAQVSRFVEEVSKTQPKCSEAFASAHCIASQRARGRWAIQLDGDIYLMTPSTRPLRNILRRLTASVGGWHGVEEMLVASKNFARSVVGVAGPVGSRNPPCRHFIKWNDDLEKAQLNANFACSDFSRRGSVVATSVTAFYMPEQSTRWTPIVNPSHCLMASRHDCMAFAYSRSQSKANGGVKRMIDPVVFITSRGNYHLRVPPRELLAHHYTEAFSWDVGRCSTMVHYIDQDAEASMRKNGVRHCFNSDVSLSHWLPAAFMRGTSIGNRSFHRLQA